MNTPDGYTNSTTTSTAAYTTTIAAVRRVLANLPPRPYGDIFVMTREMEAQLQELPRSDPIGLLGFFAGMPYEVYETSCQAKARALELREQGREPILLEIGP